MAVRNFWIEAEIDGRKTELAGGPISKTGGFSLRVKMRNDGGIVSAVRLEGYAFSDGTLRLDVMGTDPESELRHITPLGILDTDTGMPGLEGNACAFRLEGTR